MNKRIVVLSLAITLVALTLGGLPNISTAQACVDEDCGCTCPICPPSDTPLYFSLNEPFAVSDSGEVWRTGNTLHLRGLQVMVGYTLSDEEGNVVPGIAYLTVDSDVNIKSHVARTTVHIILDNDYGWFQGDLGVRARWVDGDLLGVGCASTVLYGHGDFDCFTMHIRMSLTDDSFNIEGKLWNPCIQEWNPIEMEKD
jgi:hypothetical protein